eukprot:6211343-Pleurochrysis_carterae.AAC.8
MRVHSPLIDPFWDCKGKHAQAQTKSKSRLRDTLTCNFAPALSYALASRPGSPVCFRPVLVAADAGLDVENPGAARCARFAGRSLADASTARQAEACFTLPLDIELEELQSLREGV